MGIRTFLAVETDEAVRRRLARAGEEIDDPAAKIRWVSAENLHVTLKFLGEVAEGDVAQVCGVSEGAAAEIEAFDFRVAGVRCIPPSGRLQMIWAAAVDATGRMAALQSLLESRLARLGFREERRAFRPHITMARIKQCRSPGAIREAASAFAETDFGTVHCDELVVFSSKLSPGGPIYAPLARGKLAGG